MATSYAHIRAMLEQNTATTDTIRVVLTNNKSVMLRVKEVGEDTVAGTVGKFTVAINLAAVALVSTPSDANPSKD